MRAYADDPQRSIEEFVRRRLSAIEVLSVEVEADYEQEGLPVFEITILLEGTPFEIAQKEPPGFISKLRAFVEDAYQGFPVVRFRSAALQRA